MSIEPKQHSGVRALPEIARPEDEVSLMFSGGIDSTTAALALGRRHRHVHLLTYDNGYTHQHMDRTKERVEELRRKVGDRFSHTMLSTKELFDHFLVLFKRGKVLLVVGHALHGADTFQILVHCGSVSFIQRREAGVTCIGRMHVAEGPVRGMIGVQ